MIEFDIYKHPKFTKLWDATYDFNADEFLQFLGFTSATYDVPMWYMSEEDYSLFVLRYS